MKKESQQLLNRIRPISGGVLALSIMGVSVNKAFFIYNVDRFRTTDAQVVYRAWYAAPKVWLLVLLFVAVLWFLAYGKIRPAVHAGVTHAISTVMACVFCLYMWTDGSLISSWPYAIVKIIMSWCALIFLYWGKQHRSPDEKRQTSKTTTNPAVWQKKQRQAAFLCSLSGIILALVWLFSDPFIAVAPLFLPGGYWALIFIPVGIVAHLTYGRLSLSPQEKGVE